MVSHADYCCVVSYCENTIVINKSTFITSLAPIKSCEDAVEKYKQIKKKYSDSTHNCYAYIASCDDTQQKFSDDGEPQGTAGQPMLAVLAKQNVKMTLVVVTRYFGGIKLGAGGLVSAYTASVAQAIKNAEVVKMQWSDKIVIESDYNSLKKIQSSVEALGGKIESTNFDEIVASTVWLKSEKTQKLIETVNEITLGKGKVEIATQDYHAL